MEDIFKSLSESVSEQCYDEIMGIVEDIVSYSRKKAEEATKKEDRLKSRLNKVLKAKKEDGTLDDEARDKAWAIAYTSKIANNARKARRLADDAENLHRATHDYPDDYYSQDK